MPEALAASQPEAARDIRTQFLVRGAALQPDLSGALYWPDRETLIVSDLHFEKGTSFARRRHFLPPYDTRSTLARLEGVCRRLRPARVISLGDSFHDGEAEARMDGADADRLEALTRAHDWIWILGNHDPAPPQRFGGAVETELAAGPLTFRHEPASAPATGEIAGHLHPCAVVRVRSRRLRRRCFASDGTRVIVPAFGAYAGGLNVLDEAYADLLPAAAFHAWMVGGTQVVPVAARRLLSDG